MDYQKINNLIELEERVLLIVNNTIENFDYSKIKAHNNSYGEIVQLHSAQENLLQNYRNIFLRIEALLFTIGILLTSIINSSRPIIDIGASRYLFYSLLFVGVFWIYLWWKITGWRAKYVTYFQWLIDNLENGDTFVINAFRNSHFLLKPKLLHSVLKVKISQTTFRKIEIKWPQNLYQKKLFNEEKKIKGENLELGLPFENNKITRPFRIRYILQIWMPLSFLALWVLMLIINLWK
jgi:hypothetical protein